MKSLTPISFLDLGEKIYLFRSYYTNFSQIWLESWLGWEFKKWQSVWLQMLDGCGQIQVIDQIYPSTIPIDWFKKIFFFLDWVQWYRCIIWSDFCGKPDPDWEKESWDEPHPQLKSPNSRRHSDPTRSRWRIRLV